MSLAQQCKKICERHEFLKSPQRCCICDFCSDKQDALMEHMLAVHKIRTLHFDNIFNLEGFFACLQNLAREGEHWLCPVCGDVSAGEVEWSQHLVERGHNAWDCTSIPALKNFVVCADVQDGDNDEDDDELINEEPQQGECIDGSDDDDFSPVECPFCRQSDPNIFDHVAGVHGMRMDNIFQNAARDGRLRDDYDVVRVVNALRDASDKSHQCLHCCSSFDTVEQWSCHLQDSPDHLLPRDFSNIDDAFLIPRRPNDYLISLLLELCEGQFQNAEVEPDFPMVPRVVDLGQREANV